jgi:hypothetical protein
MSLFLRLTFVGIAALLVVGVAYWFSGTVPRYQYRIRMTGGDPNQIVQKLKEFTSKTDDGNH